MDFDWKGRVILEKLREGCFVREAAMAAGMTKQAVLWRMAAHPGFREAVQAAREAGREEREFRRWLAHPSVASARQRAGGMAGYRGSLMGGGDLTAARTDGQK